MLLGKAWSAWLFYSCGGSSQLSTAHNKWALLGTNHRSVWGKVTCLRSLPAVAAAEGAGTVTHWFVKLLFFPIWLPLPARHLRGGKKQKQNKHTHFLTLWHVVQCCGRPAGGSRLCKETGESLPTGTRRNRAREEDVMIHTVNSLISCSSCKWCV